MFNLKKILHLNHQCNHQYPELIIVADAIDREDSFVRIYFCGECKDYRYKSIDHEEGDPHFFSKIRVQKYEVYPALYKLGKKI